MKQAQLVQMLALVQEGGAQGAVQGMSVQDRYLRLGALAAHLNPACKIQAAV
jgi:hypothetical protein